MLVLGIESSCDETGAEEGEVTQRVGHGFSVGRDVITGRSEHVEAEV